MHRIGHTLIVETTIYQPIEKESKTDTIQQMYLWTTISKLLLQDY